MGLLGMLSRQVRCPACSAVARHSRDQERETEIREATVALIEAVSGPRLTADDLLEGLGISAWCKLSERAFVCGACGESFDRDTETFWTAWAKKLDDKAAVIGYREARDVLREESSL